MDKPKIKRQIQDTIRWLENALKGSSDTEIPPVSELRDMSRVVEYYESLLGGGHGNTPSSITPFVISYSQVHKNGPLLGGWYDEEIRFVVENQRTQIMEMYAAYRDECLGALEKIEDIPESRLPSFMAQLEKNILIRNDLVGRAAFGREIARLTEQPPRIRPYLEKLLNVEFHDVPKIDTRQARPLSGLEQIEYFELNDSRLPPKIGFIKNAVIDFYTGHRYRLQSFGEKPLDGVEDFDDCPIVIDLSFVNRVMARPLVRLTYDSTGINVETLNLHPSIDSWHGSLSTRL